LTIIVPCYNEAERLPIADFRSFLKKHPKVKICFVNDASKDSTQDVLESLNDSFSKQVIIMANKKNLGKAGSVRKAVLYLLELEQQINLAYLDADLATSLEECYSYIQYLESGKQFVFASRILKIGSVVERKFSRFLAGRIIATFISKILDLKVYDTQCGCKVFTREIGRIAFEQPFLSKWLFDVEIFSRILKQYGKSKAIMLMEEVPVKKWVDQGESKVKPTYFFKLWIDLFRIWKLHKS